MKPAVELLESSDCYLGCSGGSGDVNTESIISSSVPHSTTLRNDKQKSGQVLLFFIKSTTHTAKQAIILKSCFIIGNRRSNIVWSFKMDQKRPFPCEFTFFLFTPVCLRNGHNKCKRRRKERQNECVSRCYQTGMGRGACFV